jgi:ABC-2 type transport system ATP-binding protein
MNIIEIKNMSKEFNGLTAVDNIKFSLKKGEIFGLLGPNGAGKTTIISILATILKPSSCDATICGHDIINESDDVRRCIGIVFQDPSLDNDLTARENLDFHARLYDLKSDIRKKRIKQVLDIVELTDRADNLVKTFSGGMKRRLEIARGLMHYPKVLFLDEPTLGLDPQTSLDTPEKLKRQVGGDVIIIETKQTNKLKEKVELLKGVYGTKIEDSKLTITAKQGDKMIPKIVSLANKTKIKIDSVSLRRPSLDDVFLHYTGKRIRKEGASKHSQMMTFMKMRGMRR